MEKFNFQFYRDDLAEQIKKKPDKNERIDILKEVKETKEYREAKKIHLEDIAMERGEKFDMEKSVEVIKAFETADENETLPIENLEESNSWIRMMFDKGERPIVTVLKEHLDDLKRDGLKEHSTWIPGFNIIAGTLGRDPYKEEGRIKVRVIGISADQVEPRFTADNKFNGVVRIKGPIGPDALEIME